MRTMSLAPKDILGLTLAAACWGTGTVISKGALAEVPPLVLLPIQLAASLAVLGVLMRRRGLRFGADMPRLLGRLGILNPGIAYALSLIGLVSISASLSVLIWALEPLMILLLAGVVLRERIGLSLVSFTAVAVAGMVLLLYDPASGGQWSGIALTIAGVGCCAVYTIIARRWIGSSDSTLQVVATQQGYALAFGILAVIGLVVLDGGVRLPVTAFAWASAIGSGVLYYGAAYWFYLSALRNVPASFAAICFYLIPIFGVGGGILLLGERLQVGQWIGVAVVLAAVLAIAIGPAARPRNTPSVAS